MLSQTAEYALRAALHLAAHPGSRPTSVGELAEALDVPRNYLSKTLHLLARAGILASTRGKRGGFRLARPPADIPLCAVVAPFGPFGGEPRCILGRPVCSDRKPCPAHARWRAAAAATQAFFRDTTLADLLPARRRCRVRR
jgi:Rrf2 family protein